MNRYLRYALLGLAVGGRTSAGPAAVAWTGSNDVARKVTAVGAAVELLGDKLPQTPSRLEAPGLVARAVSAAGSAMVLAGRHGDEQRVAAGVAIVAAGLGANIGSRLRVLLAAPPPPEAATLADMAVTTRAARARGVKNVAAGAVEDVAVAALAYRAVKA